MNAEDIIAALQLPAASRVDRRVPKTLLLEHGAQTPADKRHISERIGELTWLAALKPTTIGVPEYRDGVREYLEIAALRLTLRGAPERERADSASTRLVELVHRAVPYPVVLVIDHDQAHGAGLSVAHKRWSQGEAGKMVLDGDLITFDWDGRGGAAWYRRATGALALSGQPRTTMLDLYQGWMDVVVSMRVASVTGIFVGATSPEQAAERLKALRKCERLDAEIAHLRATAAKEKQVARQIELNLALKRLEADKAEARSRL